MQIWVPHVRSMSFHEQAHRQSMAVAASGRAHHDQDFVDAVEFGFDE